MANSPLEGVRVVEWAVWQNGPAAGYMLGDLGAEVIKIEHPRESDPARGVATLSGADAFLPGRRSTPFENANRSKKSITLDLQTEKGREVVHRLVEKSDIFFTNYRPFVARKLKLDYPDLVQVNPRLIYAYNTGFGLKGEDSELRAFDQLAQARTGLMWAAGDRDFEQPVTVQGALMDQIGATMLAFALVTALLVRERQGISQCLDVSLYGSSLHLQALNLNATVWQGRPIPRHSRDRCRNPLDNHYKCADGQWLRFAESQSDRFWPEFANALAAEGLAGDPRFNTNEGRRQNFAELIPLLDRIFAGKPRDEWLRIFKQKGCQFARGPVLKAEEVVNDPQALVNDYIVEYDHPTMGRVKTVGLPMHFDKTPARIQNAPPEFGQHTEEVLLDVAGYSWEEIARMRAEGVL
ncbi:MAG: CoA transferase [Chloroflexi bacterium]|nr:CoA transferase [Chloroflexota bacterium]